MTSGTTARASARDLFEAAVAHHLGGRVDEAIAAYRETLALDAQFAPAFNNLGALLGSIGRREEALASFESAVNADRNYAEARSNLGIALAQVERYDEAIAHFEAALAMEPRRAHWWNNLGNALVERFRFDKALSAYDKAIDIDKSVPDFWSNRGLALRGLRRPDDAIASFEKAVAVDPRFSNALVNLGIVLKEQKQLDAAVAAFERARAIRPNDCSLLCNYASVYETRGEEERMRELAELAATLDTSSPEPHVLIGNYHMARAEYAEAESAYQRARSLDAENRNANWNLALIWLLHGDFRRGWAQFAWRKRLQSVLLDHYEYPGVPWSGDALAGRSILLHCEQGIGDAIQFVRYAEELKRRGAGRVIVESPSAVTSLLTTARGVDEVVERGATLPAFDVHASLMDLPVLCGTEIDSIPCNIPYLESPARPVSSTIESSGPELKVGFVWAGNPGHQRDHLRSVSLGQFSTLFAQRDVRFFSLQKGGPERELSRYASERVVDLASQLTDFRDTAAAISALDLVITVDTSVAHLAAALGVETWILITHVPDFRWLLDRSDSPWYPSVKLFRQPTPKDWASVIADVATALSHRARERTGTDSSQPMDDTVTMLASAVRHADGRPQFELEISIADLADPATFASFEREMLGGGDEAAVTRFLLEAMRDGDVLVDPAPGLGLTALAVATAESPRAIAHVTERSAARGRRMKAAARTTAADRLVIHANVPNPGTLGAALEQSGRERTPRVVVRIGDSTATPELLGALAADGALDISGVIWPAARARDIASALGVLQEHGFWLGTIGLQHGEVVVDPLVDLDTAQAIAAIDTSFLADLGATTDTTVEAQPVRHDIPAAPVPTSWLAFDWEVRGDTGWGLYGLNLATQLAMKGDPAPIVLACNEPTLPTLARHRLHDTLVASREVSAALNDPDAVVTIEGTLLRAYGNGFVGSPHSVSLRADKNVGVVFFEDTHLDAAAVERARSHDAIIAGSNWNAEVLRAYGLENVHTVIQGIDPTIFHPACRTGAFEDRFVIFSGGKLEYRKGQDLVVAAFRRFLERHNDALLITAWHNHWPQLITDLDLAGHVRGVPTARNGALLVADWLEANGIPHRNVIDVGCTPNVLMGQIVREADVALFPNRCEGGTNLVAMECMAAGIPTIVSANTGHLDLTATGGCFALRTQREVASPSRYYRGIDGWGESDVDEMVALLERLYADRTLAAERAAVGAAAMAGMTWSTQVDALLRAIA